MLAMPNRKDKDMERLYKAIFVIPAGTKHDSGYMHIAIVGLWVENKKEKYKICSYPDDINWVLPNSKMPNYNLAHLRTDCWYPEGILHFWGRGQFKVDWSSSTEVEFIPDKK